MKVTVIVGDVCVRLTTTAEYPDCATDLVNRAGLLLREALTAQTEQLAAIHTDDPD